MPTLRIRVRVQPRAARTRVIGRYGESLKVQVQAAPVDGSANASVVELIAATFAVPLRAVRIVQGETSRDKLVEIEPVDIEAAQLRLATLMSTGKGR